ncbi:right-handed parallel beta-helix repeat-containing protein [Sphingobacterium mizutaii]|uniref:right-handed parallel beta-helix repeat-containing protein n=1 Tax=Sphingobacterium mizutaii TaxID=1010 RepID=UPI001623B2B3|nr:right-handed parallel beta-helix repeat-containing protein [Sphingobacterium mizutaii]
MKVNIQYIIIGIILSINPFLANCQFISNKVLSKSTSNYSKKSEILSIKNSIFSNGIDLTVFLPKGYSKIGDVDYTSYLQHGIDQNKLVILPNFPVLINAKGLRLKSNSSVLFQENSKLILKPNNEQLYGMIYIENIRNVNVYFANLEGDRYNHLTDKGEWGMGIFIRSSENVKIYNPVIQYMWGDGIYIGKNNNNSPKNITISSALINECRRNGFSLISGENITLTNSLITNTFGTAPEFGIDIEPNSPDEKLINIVLSNNKTYNNKGGVLFALDKLVDYRYKDSNIDIQLNNHIDNYSGKGIEFYMNRYNRNFGKRFLGSLKIRNLQISNSSKPFINNKGFSIGTTLSLESILINNKKITNDQIYRFKRSFQTGGEGLIF